MTQKLVPYVRKPKAKKAAPIKSTDLRELKPSSAMTEADVAAFEKTADLLDKCDDTLARIEEKYELVPSWSPADLARDLRSNGLSAAPAVHAYLFGLKPGASQKTMTQQLDKIARFWSELVGAPFTRETLPWHRMTSAHSACLKNWLAKTCTPKSANLTLCALRGVLNACSKARPKLMTYEDLRDALPSQVTGSREPKGRALSQDEIQALFRACDVDAIGVRDRALLALLYGLGLRLEEVALLDVEKLESGELRVLGKGNKERVMHVQGKALDELNAYLDIRRGGDTGPMFLHDRKPERLGRSGISDRVEILAKRAGLECSPHDLRRSFATALIDATNDLGTVSKLMGHSSITTTQIYDKRGDKAKQAVIKKLPEWE